MMAHDLHAARPATQPQTVLIFSPHPDDDVISMGGTLIRLVEQGHKVHVAYMTSGNIAVFDHDAWRFTDFVVEFNRLFGIDQEQSEAVKERVQEFLRSKKPGQPDSEDLLKIKRPDPRRRRRGRRRWRAACRRSSWSSWTCVSTAPAPSPRRRSIRRTSTTSSQLLERLQAGPDLRGRRTVRSARHAPGLCRGDLRGGAARCAARGNDFEVWLYRGAWEEWEPHEIERVVPLSPERPGAQEAGHLPPPIAEGPGHVPRRHATAASSGSGPRTATATRPRCTTQLGLPEFYALEGFVQWRDA